MTRRRRAVDLLDQHAARRVAAGARALDQHARDRAPDPRSIRFRVGEKGDELPIAARQIGGERAVDEDHRRADRSRRPSPGVTSEEPAETAEFAENLGSAVSARSAVPSVSATSAPRRTGSPDRWPPARRSRVRPARRAASAAGRARRASRTASRRGRRRSSRAGCGRVPPCPSAPDTRCPKPPATPSAATASRVTTPCRASSCWVTAAAHFVVVACSREPFRRAPSLADGLARLRPWHQRPPSLGRRRREPPRSKRRDRRLPAFHPPPRRARARERAQRVKRVVGDQSLPDQVPQRVDGFGGIAAADRLVERTEERRAAIARAVEDRVSRSEISGPAEAGHYRHPDALSGSVRL